jgi:class 3 adenylate cyclase
MVAARWSAEHPDRVSHLILWCTWASRSRVAGQSQTRTLRALVEQDWVIYTETVARVLLGWSSEEVAKKFAEFYRACTTPEVLKKHVPAVYEWDVSSKLPLIKCPTLVIQRRDIPTLPPDLSRELAREIPDARLMLLDGQSPLPFAEDTDSLLAAIAGFLGTGGEVHAVSSAAQAPVTILFTDMESSTATTQRLGDAGAQEVLKSHNRIVRNALVVHGGTEIKHTGDGLMVSFQSATRAVECAVSIQRAVVSYAREHPDVPLRVRVGLNAGEPLADRGDYFGTAVQLASRVCDACPPGQILVSGVVRDLTAGKGFRFKDRGEETLKGFDEPVRLFTVDWETRA